MFLYKTLLLAGLLAVSSAIDASCRIHFSLNSRMSDFDIAQEVDFSAMERPYGRLLKVSREGLVKTVILEEPNYLYRTVEVFARGQLAGGEESASRAYYLVWPCVREEKVDLIMNKSSGSAREIRLMWESDVYENPPDDWSALKFQYSKTLAAVEARFEANPESKHQYDVIATYLALRAFNNLVNKSVRENSSLPPAQSERLKKVANWHRILLSHVNPSNLDRIFLDGDGLASEVIPLSSMYNVFWRNIKELRDPKSAFEHSRRFKQSILSEPESQTILNNLRLNRTVLVESVNYYAGAWLRSDENISSDDLDALQDYVTNLEGMAGGWGEAERYRLVADMEYLSSMVEQASYW